MIMTSNLQQRKRSDTLDTQLTNSSSHANKVEELFWLSCGKEIFTIGEVKTIYFQWRSVAGYLCVLGSKMPGFRDLLAEKIADGH